MSIEKSYRQVIEEEIPNIMAEAGDPNLFSGGPHEHKYAMSGAVAVACSLGRALAKAGHYADEFEVFELFGLPPGFIQFLREEKATMLLCAKR